ncbi:5'/3'-nucleotidase SurE [Oscillatoria sp. CS-180]|uniref:5'/3'-nucleotidase SurE n=1 Tax=Oscillatoria sp. CS-180 TaxID=3021720 RepID=UPI00232B99A1|nr:5'/3'-nucleotidase SurE [Oscillatoria sp. CS-180]MDB9527095.1 5'/3'-nucleotidase SurE [Oscillatoria sp. CS-180]
MKLLISNDDGIFANGIRSLANTMAEAGHEVWVVCPDRERSATGHGLTLHKPIRAEQVEGVFHADVQAWACSGTPSDCVKLALGAILENPPDMVLSGINQGANLGTDVLYSGTVSAAMEGIIEGIPAIAFSLTNYACKNFVPAAQFAKNLVNVLRQHPIAAPPLLNVNIPAVEAHQIKGSVIARQGVRRYVDLFEKRSDPRGKTYYWLAGEVLEAVEHEEDSYQLLTEQLQRLSDFSCLEGTPIDVEAIQQNLITITPLHYNLTSPLGICQLQAWQTQFDKQLLHPDSPTNVAKS